jgi:protein JSN1
VGAIRIGFAKVPVKNGQEGEDASLTAQGIGELGVGPTIQALRTVKGASSIPADEQVLGGAVENYRSNLLLTMITSGQHSYVTDGTPKPVNSITEQQMIMRELTAGNPDADADIQALAGMYDSLSCLTSYLTLIQTSVLRPCTIQLYPWFLSARTTVGGMRLSFAS